MGTRHYVVVIFRMDKWAEQLKFYQFFTGFILNLHRVRHGELGGAGQVVDYQVNEVLLLDPVVDLTGGLGVPRLLLAQDLAVDADVHIDFVRGAADAVASQDLTQVLGLVDATFRGLTEREAVVLVGQLSVAAGHLDGLNPDLTALLKICRCNSGNIEAGNWVIVRHDDACHQEDDGGPQV